MAEPTRSPSLPSTADATPYVPVSWMAVAAVAVAGLFGLLLFALGATAFSSKKPLIMEELLVLPVVTVVLSFAARRMIRNSEGTRTGENLANGAWWAALVLGLCYVAYLFAIDFAVKRDAGGEVEKWMGYIKKGTDEDTGRAFHRTLSPGERQGVAPDDRYAMQSRFRDDLLAFDNSDLLRLAKRNREEFRFVPGGVTWTYKPGSTEAIVAGTVTCPEGTFPVLVGLKGVEGVTGADGAGGGRQWSVVRPPSGFIDQRTLTRTPYGWLLHILEMDGGAFGKGFVSYLAVGPTSHAYAYRAFVVPGGDRSGWGAVAYDRDLLAAQMWQLAFAVPARALGDDGYTEYMANQFFKLPGGAEPSPEQKDRFFASWRSYGVKLAGDKLKDQGGDPIDKEFVIAVTETAIEVRVPIEIPLLGTSGKHEVARGRVLVACTDPALLAELKELKSAANPSQGSVSPNDEMVRRKVPWRVVRIESDMAPINVTPAVRDPAGPGR